MSVGLSSATDHMFPDFSFDGAELLWTRKLNYPGISVDVFPNTSAPADVGSLCLYLMWKV